MTRSTMVLMAPGEVSLVAGIELHKPSQQAPVQHVLFRLVPEGRLVVEQPVRPVHRTMHTAPIVATASRHR